MSGRHEREGALFDGPRSLEPLIRRVYAYVAYRVGDGADAEDITQKTDESDPSQDL